MAAMTPNERSEDFRRVAGSMMAQARVRAGLTARETARAVGTSAAQLSRWERGAVMPRLDSLVRLAVVLGAEPQELIPDAMLLGEAA